MENRGVEAVEAAAAAATTAVLATTGGAALAAGACGAAAATAGAAATAAAATGAAVATALGGVTVAAAGPVIVGGVVIGTGLVTGKGSSVVRRRVRDKQSQRRPPQLPAYDGALAQLPEADEVVTVTEEVEIVEIRLTGARTSLAANAAALQELLAERLQEDAAERREVEAQLAAAVFALEDWAIAHLPTTSTSTMPGHRRATLVRVEVTRRARELGRRPGWRRARR